MTTIRFFGLAAAFCTAFAPNISRAQDTLRVGLPVPGYLQLTPLFVAQERGFIEEQNLKVETTIYQGGAGVQEALVAGSADIVDASTFGITQAIEKGVHQKCIAMAADNANGWYIVVDKNSPIENLREVAGKRMGISGKGSNTDFYAQWAQRKYGFKAETVPLGNGSLLFSALSSGQVATATLGPIVSYRMLIENKVRPLVDLGKELPPNYQGCWASLDSTIEQKADQIRRFFVAFQEGLNYMRANPDDALEFIRKFTEENNDQVVRRSYEDFKAKIGLDTTTSRSSLEKGFELAGMTNLPPIEAIVSDKFFPIVK